MRVPCTFSSLLGPLTSPSMIFSLLFIDPPHSLFSLLLRSMWSLCLFTAAETCLFRVFLCSLVSFPFLFPSFLISLSHSEFDFHFKRCRIASFCFARALLRFFRVPFSFFHSLLHVDWLSLSRYASFSSQKSFTRIFYSRSQVLNGNQDAVFPLDPSFPPSRNLDIIFSFFLSISTFFLLYHGFSSKDSLSTSFSPLTIWFPSLFHF